MLSLMRQLFQCTNISTIIFISTWNAMLMYEVAIGACLILLNQSSVLWKVTNGEKGKKILEEMTICGALTFQIVNFFLRLTYLLTDSWLIWLIKETFSKNWNWKEQFDQYFWQNKASWISRLSVDLFWSTKHANSVLFQNFQIMAGYQKMWSNCIFHFIFLEKVSFS